MCNSNTIDNTQANSYHFSHARTALKFGLQALGLKAGDEILIPDFICNVVLHPLDQLGIQYRFYPIMDNMAPDWQNMAKLVSQDSKAIIMVHYFGQPQDISRFQKFCKQHSLLLIEDNAHGHGGEFNGKPLGTYGEIGISSPRKLLNTICGGVLFLNGEIKPNIMNLNPYPVSGQLLFQQKLFNRFPNLKALLKKIIKHRPRFEDPRAFQEPIINDYLMDAVSLKTFKNRDWEEVRRERQIAYRTWEFFVKRRGLKPVFKALHPGANPWCFPAYVENKREAIRWFNWGYENYYNVFSWPTLPEEIIQKGGNSLKRWEVLVCFDTNQMPKI